MSRVSESVTKTVNALPQRFYLFKINLSEKLAIRKKKKLFSAVKWTEGQKKEFDDFWLKNYGKKIKPWWHKLYESANGVYRCDYFPEYLYSTKLEPALNPPEYCRVFSDKSLTETIYGGVEDVVFPETLIACANSVFSCGDGVIMNPAQAAESLCDAGKCVIKPTVETGSGKGVRFLDFAGGTDTVTGEKAEKIFADYKKDFIVQKIVRNNKALSEIFPNSLNTFRVITYIADGTIYCMPVSLRIGVGENCIDNIHKGGLVAGVNDDGTLKKYAYQLGYGDSKTKFDAHPDTGVKFEGKYVGDVRKMTGAAKRLHSVTPQLGMISWDLTIDENENIVLIEANCTGQSIWFPQIVNEKPAFGENTAAMLKLIR